MNRTLMQLRLLRCLPSIYYSDNEIPASTDHQKLNFYSNIPISVLVKRHHNININGLIRSWDYSILVICSFGVLHRFDFVRRNILRFFPGKWPSWWGRVVGASWAVIDQREISGVRFIGSGYRSRKKAICVEDFLTQKQYQPGCEVESCFLLKLWVVKVAKIWSRYFGVLNVYSKGFTAELSGSTKVTSQA